MTTTSMRRRASLRQRLNISRFALAHPRLTIGAWLLIAAAGLVAAWKLPVALFPDIAFPVVVVTALAPDQASGRLEELTAAPIEKRLLGVADRGPLTITTAAGRVTATVPFRVGIDLATAERRVRAALAGVVVADGARLEIQRIDLNEAPVVTYGIAPRGATGLDHAEGLAAMLAGRLAEVPGVARVMQLGIQAQQSALAPARVRLDGKPAVALEVVKHASANTLTVADAVATVVSDATATLPLRIVAVRAEAPFIRDATGATLEALWGAVVLSVIVIYPFLGSLRATAISALAIPTSLVGTFLVMALSGFKFETITLLALALVIGIIVDDAIVDVENIARHLPHAADPHLAALRATDEIGLTVTAATLTIAAVFVPVGLMGGVVGTFFRPFGLTISAAVLTSLLVARTLTPVLAARWLTAGSESAASAGWQRFSHHYRRLLERSLQHPVVVLLTAGASFLGGLALIPMIPQGFIPALDRGECIVRFTLPAGVGLATADSAAAQLAARVRSDPDVAVVLSVAGSADGAQNRGELHVTLRPERAATTQAVEARLRHALAGETSARVSVENVPIIAVAAAQPLEITLTAHDAGLLPLAAERVRDRIGQWNGVADASIDGIGAAGDGTSLRRDGRPAAVIHGNLDGTTSLGLIADRVVAEVPGLLPAGVRLALSGESAQAAEVFGHFASALGLALAGVLIVLLVLFRGWRDPIAIGISLPLSAVGAMFGLFVARADFGIVSLLGLVFLTGLVNKNAIILVDRINQLRRAGLPRDAAILEAGPVRLRPIMMTSAAAVLGMLPVAIGFGAGAELRAPMAVAIIGGLLTSTLLSLVVVPVVYQLLDRLWPRKRWTDPTPAPETR